MASQASQESDDSSDLIACSTDGHYRFTPERRLNTAYCIPCNSFFLRDLKTLENHFKVHEPANVCQYCKKDTYEYVLIKPSGEKTNEVFHKCACDKENEKEEEAELSDTAATAINDANANVVGPEQGN